MLSRSGPYLLQLRVDRADEAGAQMLALAVDLIDQRVPPLLRIVITQIPRVKRFRGRYRVGRLGRHCFFDLRCHFCRCTLGGVHLGVVNLRRPARDQTEKDGDQDQQETSYPHQNAETALEPTHRNSLRVTNRYAG